MVRVSQLHLPFWMVRLPAVSRAFEASLGRLVRTTEAAIVRGASDVSSSSSGIRSLGDSDMLGCEWVGLEGFQDEAKYVVIGQGVG
jgi:hypothetical protein